MGTTNELLTNEELRQQLAEAIPGFPHALALALGTTPAGLYAAVEAGQVTKLQAISALGGYTVALLGRVTDLEDDLIDRTGTVDEANALREQHKASDT